MGIEANQIDLNKDGYTLCMPSVSKQFETYKGLLSKNNKTRVKYEHLPVSINLSEQ